MNDEIDDDSNESLCEIQLENHNHTDGASYGNGSVKRVDVLSHYDTSICIGFTLFIKVIY